MPKKLKVFIHGGGFYMGSSTLESYDPRILVAKTGIIAVNMQYRLGAFGFLYLNDQRAPGNMGLLDQVLALKWIHDNIIHFGGDKHRITIMGQSAGAASVNFHMFSPLSKNLFRNAILESGTALADWALLNHENALNRSFTILNGIGCNGQVTEMLNCLNRLDASTILNQSAKIFTRLTNIESFPIIFLPVVDNYFLLDEPLNILKQGKFKRCPIMIGVNENEGNIFLPYAISEYRDLSRKPLITREKFLEYLKILNGLFSTFNFKPNENQLNAIEYRYSHWPNLNNINSNYDNLDNLINDVFFTCPANELATTYALFGQNVFFYQFAHYSSKSSWPAWFGVVHSDEIDYVFGRPLNSTLRFTLSEKNLSQKMITYWSNFVKFESPNGPYIKRQRIIEYWSNYRIVNSPNNDFQREYLMLRTRSNRAEFNLRAQFCAFWNFLIQNV
jgi:acetylcholinesterase